MPICTIPKEIIEIEFQGNILLCGCGMFLPTVVGNILDINSFDEVHELELSKKIIHSTTMSKTFEYCVKNDNDDFLCGLPTKKPGNFHMSMKTGGDGSSCTLNKDEIKIVVGYDSSCQLECPSCRLFPLSYYTKSVGNVLIAGGSEELDIIKDVTLKAFRKHGKVVVYKVAKKYKSYLSPWYTDLIKQLDNKTVSLINNYKKPALIEFGASGDGFFSQSVKNCISKLEYNPMHRYRFKTNGLMMRSIIPSLKIKDAIKFLTISVDAGTKETHEKLRLGSSWNQLLSNINWVMQLDNKPEISVTFVMQKDNFREYPRFLELFLDEIGVDFTHYIPLFKATDSYWTDEDFAERNVLSHSHPDNQECLDILEDMRQRYGRRAGFIQI